MSAARKSRLSQEGFDAIARAVSDPRRFAILQQISACSGMGCGALHEHECISPATISHHIKELAEAGLIDVVREGRNANLVFRREVWQGYLDRLAQL